MVSARRTTGAATGSELMPTNAAPPAGPICSKRSARQKAASTSDSSMSSHKRRSLARSFVDRHGLWSEAQARAAAAVDKAIVQKKLELVRFSFPDQHGVLRGKTLVSRKESPTLRNGVTTTNTQLAQY